jgi:hypothetical protein
VKKEILPLNLFSNVLLRFQYSVQVPVFKTERYSSIPLSGGSATPYIAEEAPPVNIVKRIDGQYISWDMVPKRLNCKNDEADTSRAAPPDIDTVRQGDSEKLPLLNEEKDEGGVAYGSL